MHIPLRAVRRLAFTAWFGVAGLFLVAAQGRAATPAEKMLPDSTLAFVKINNAAALREAFRQSQFGQLWNDPAVKAWKNDIMEKVDDASKTLKEKIGVTYTELFELPQGPTSIAFLKRDDPQVPMVLMVIADAGKNTSTMNEVLTKATKQGAANGAKVSTETFRGVTIHVIQPPKGKADAEEKGKEKKADPRAADRLVEPGERLHHQQRRRGDEGPHRPRAGPRRRARLVRGVWPGRQEARLRRAGVLVRRPAQGHQVVDPDGHRGQRQ